jgi:hypothetical protein
MSSREDAKSDIAQSRNATANIYDKTPGARWDELCERCVKIPWEGLVRPANGVVQPDHIIQLNQHLSSEYCRLCRLLSRVYSNTPRGIPETLTPDDSKPPMFQFQRRLLREQWAIEVEDYDVQWILTDLDPKNGEFLNEYQQSQPDCVDFDMAKSWTRKCKAEHARACRPASTAFIKQLKVIDCDKRRIVPAPVPCTFVALSYVWGQSSTAQRGGVDDLRELPNTIADAILVTKALGYRYLWIDRYVSPTVYEAMIITTTVNITITTHPDVLNTIISADSLVRMRRLLTSTVHQSRRLTGQGNANSSDGRYILCGRAHDRCSRWEQPKSWPTRSALGNAIFPTGTRAGRA